MLVHLERPPQARTMARTRDSPRCSPLNVIPRSSADYKRIRPGDVILKIDQDPVADRVALRKAITKLRGRGQVLLLVPRERYGYYVTLDLS